MTLIIGSEELVVFVGAARINCKWIHPGSSCSHEVRHSLDFSMFVGNPRRPCASLLVGQGISISSPLSVQGVALRWCMVGADRTEAQINGARDLA